MSRPKIQNQFWAELRQQFKNTSVFGYYNSKSISGRAATKIQEYIIYQLIDPLIKFSKYEERHKHRLRAYFEREENQESIREALSCIIGDTLAKYLIYKILDNDFALSLLFIKRCKFRMLFINGNFVFIPKEIFKKVEIIKQDFHTVHKSKRVVCKNL